MKYRYIGILGGCIGRYQTLSEARAFVTAIPGMRGIILDRLLTPENPEGDDSEPLWRPIVIKCEKQEMQADR
jgi:hypothetical protein